MKFLPIRYVLPMDFVHIQKQGINILHMDVAIKFCRKVKSEL